MDFNILQIGLLIFIVFVLLRILKRFRNNDVIFKEWLLWSLFWLVVLIATFLPQSTDFLAKKIGLETGRGVDLAVYISIPVLFYLVFKIIAKMDKIQQNQTKIVRHLAIKNFEEKNKK